MTAVSEPSQEDVRAVAAYLSERTGLSFAGRREPQLISAIAEAIAGGSDVASYRRKLERGGPEFDELVALLTVSESYFFREANQLDLLGREILPDWLAGGHTARPLRLWSAGCARGEEAYTLAILLEEAGIEAHACILASDLSVVALRSAEVGVYAPWALRAATERQREAYFHPVGSGYEIDERFRRLVTFRAHNLLDAGLGIPPMDVVFCRNVLIYFERAAVDRAAARLASSLAPGGWLVTGSSDPPLEVPGLDPVPTTAGVVYRRPVAGRAATSGPTPAPPNAESKRNRPQAATLRRRPWPTRPPAPLPRPDPQWRPAKAEAEGKSFAPDAADEVRSLGDAGDIAGAVAAANVAVETFPLDVELRYLQAVLLLEASRPDDAAAAARAVLYLEPTLIVAHLVLADAEQALGHRAAAERRLRNARSLLAALAPTTIVPLSGGEPAGRMAAMAAAQLRARSGDAVASRSEEAG